MPIYALGDRVPDIHPDAYVHPDAVVIGSVTVGAEGSVWPGAVLRADSDRIVVGARTSVQDGTVVHTTVHQPTLIGEGCVVGHMVHLEGCIIEDGALIGSGSVVLNLARIGAGALVGANAVVSNNVVVPPRARALGVPAKITEDVVPEGAFAAAAEHYVARTRQYKAELRRID